MNYVSILQGTLLPYVTMGVKCSMREQMEFDAYTVWFQNAENTISASLTVYKDKDLFKSVVRITEEEYLLMYPYNNSYDHQNFIDTYNSMSNSFVNVYENFKAFASICKLAFLPPYLPKSEDC